MKSKQTFFLLILQPFENLNTNHLTPNHLNSFIIYCVNEN